MDARPARLAGKQERVSVGRQPMARYREGNTRADTYKIVRMYFRGGKRTIETGLTLEQAQAHCGDKETSSSTCTSASGKARTHHMGPWFDGYTKE